MTICMMLKVSVRGRFGLVCTHKLEYAYCIYSMKNFHVPNASAGDVFNIIKPFNLLHYGHY
jgi:hypothetical protein